MIGEVCWVHIGLAIFFHAPWLIVDNRKGLLSSFFLVLFSSSVL